MNVKIFLLLGPLLASAAPSLADTYKNNHNSILPRAPPTSITNDPPTPALPILSFSRPDWTPNPTRIPWLHHLLVGVSKVHEKQSLAQLDYIHTRLDISYGMYAKIIQISMHYRIPNLPGDRFIQQMGGPFPWWTRLKPVGEIKCVDPIDLEVLFRKHMDVEDVFRALFKSWVVRGWNEWHKVRVFLPSEDGVGEGPEKRLGRQILMRFESFKDEGKVVWLGVESGEVVVV